MKLTPERIAEIKAMEAAATNGPWRASDEYVYRNAGVLIWAMTHGPNENDDAAFIAMSRAAIPKLLADREALMDEIETMRDVCSKLVTDAIGSMERPRIFGYGHTRQEIAAVDAGDIIRALQNVVEIKIDATLTDQED